MEKVYRRVRISPSYASSHLIYSRPRYDKRVDDYNFGSLIRTDATGEYSQINSLFGTYAVVILQSCPHMSHSHAHAVLRSRGPSGSSLRLSTNPFKIARNRLGYNDEVYEAAQREKEKSKAKKKGKKVQQ